MAREIGALGWVALGLLVAMARPAQAAYRAVEAGDVADLSVMVAPELPCTWPGEMFEPYMLHTYVPIGPGPFATDLSILDEHTGTQWDAPQHFVPPPESGLPNAAKYGAVESHELPIWQFVGEACVVDVTDLRDSTPPGVSPLITTERVKAWEARHRPLRSGDVVLFRSDYSDAFYVPYPEGRRFVAEVLAGEAPGWPDPDVACMEYLHSKGVMTLGIDSPSMGPLPHLQAAVHIAGARLGMIWVEMATQLRRLPATGAFFAFLAPKHEAGSGGECRAVAVVKPDLAGPLLEAARAHRVADLSVLLSERYPVWWPGRGIGRFWAPYKGFTVNRWDGAWGAFFARMHILDSHTGTHLVPPSFSLPGPGFDDGLYDTETRQLLAGYERRYGARGTSRMTTERVPIERMMGPARVVDVRGLLGTTDPGAWPASPAITVETLSAYEDAHGLIERGDVVLFHSGHTDRTFLPFPSGRRCIAAPLAGEAEGWPAPTPEAIRYLAERWVRCVGTDAPSLGSVVHSESVMTHWALGAAEMVGVAYLTNLGDLPSRDAFFLFAPIKQRGGHGGHGRAMALF
jgi:kynurenine formamidase